VSASNSIGTSAWSEIWNFTTIKNPQKPEIPLLVSPAKDTIGVLQSRNVVWNLVDGAETYRFQLSKDSTFASTITDQAGIIGQTSTYSGLAQNTRYFWRVNATNTVGTSDWSEVWGFTTRSLEGVEENALPGIWLACTPNPVSKDAIFSFDVLKSGTVKLSVISLLGEEVIIVLNEWKPSGQYSVKSNIELPQGHYFIRLQTQAGAITRELQVTQ